MREVKRHIGHREKIVHTANRHFLREEVGVGEAMFRDSKLKFPTFKERYKPSHRRTRQETKSTKK